MSPTVSPVAAYQDLLNLAGCLEAKLIQWHLQEGCGEGISPSHRWLPGNQKNHIFIHQSEYRLQITFGTRSHPQSNKITDQLFVVRHVFYLPQVLASGRQAQKSKTFFIYHLSFFIWSFKRRPL